VEQSATGKDGEPNLRRRSGVTREAPRERIDPAKALEHFDLVMRNLGKLNGDEWTSALREEGDVVGRLGTQKDFQSFVAAALMVKRISDLSMSRLMRNEVSAIDTLAVLDGIHYTSPSDRQMRDFAREFHPDGKVLRKVPSPESALDFVSQFESEDIFLGSYEKNDASWELKEIVTEKKLMYSLLMFAYARMGLQFARLTAVYLIKGGRTDLVGKPEFDNELSRVVGKEIDALQPPLFAGTSMGEKPNAASMSFYISGALRTIPESGR
jgi:hypothetical protein